MRGFGKLESKLSTLECDEKLIARAVDSQIISKYAQTIECISDGDTLVPVHPRSMRQGFFEGVRTTETVGTSEEFG